MSIFDKLQCTHSVHRCHKENSSVSVLESYVFVCAMEKYHLNCTRITFWLVLTCIIKGNSWFYQWMNQKAIYFYQINEKNIPDFIFLSLEYSLYRILSHLSRYGKVVIVTALSSLEMLVHYSDVIMGAMASQITSLTIVHSTVNLSADQRKHESSASLVFVRGIHRWPVHSPHKWPVTRKMFPFDDVVMGPWFESSTHSRTVPFVMTVSSLAVSEAGPVSI